MKFMLLTIFFASQSAFCAHNKKAQVIIVEKVSLAPAKYTKEESDADDALWFSIRKECPLLTTLEIGACIRYCKSYPTHNVMIECHELQLWKAIHLEELSKKTRIYDSCYNEYRHQLS